MDAAKFLFKSLEKYSDLDKLITDGESENYHLECKEIIQPNFGREIQAKLAEVLSGFSNTEGGVLLLGVNTTKHSDSSDIISQITPIGNCANFQKIILNKIPILTSPAIFNAESKIIKKKIKDSRGVIIIHIPKTIGDPIRSLIDNHFYFRAGDEFKIAPYEMIKRLFAATDSPDIHFITQAEDIEYKEKEDEFIIPITFSNESSAIGEHIQSTLEVLNFDECEKFVKDHFQDISMINKGKKIFSYKFNGVIHKGLNSTVSFIRVKLKGKKKKLQLAVTIYANKMIPRRKETSVILNKKKSILKNLGEKTLF